MHRGLFSASLPLAIVYISTGFSNQTTKAAHTKIDRIRSSAFGAMLWSHSTEMLFIKAKSTHPLFSAVKLVYTYVSICRLFARAASFMRIYTLIKSPGPAALVLISRETLAESMHEKRTREVCLYMCLYAQKTGKSVIVSVSARDRERSREAKSSPAANYNMLVYMVTYVRYARWLLTADYFNQASEHVSLCGGSLCVSSDDWEA